MQFKENAYKYTDYSSFIYSIKISTEIPILNNNCQDQVEPQKFINLVSREISSFNFRMRDLVSRASKDVCDKFGELCSGNQNKKRSRSRFLTDIPNNQEKREKRSAIVVGGAILLALGGTSVYSAYRTVQIQRDLDNYISNQNKINKRINDDITKINIGLESMYKYVSDEIKNIQNFIDDTKCELDNIRNRMITDSFLTNLKNQFLSIEKAAVGELTEEIISIENLISIISNEKSLTESIYVDSPNLIYDLGISVIEKIDWSSNEFSFTVMIPNINKDNISPIYTILNVGWIEENKLLKYKIPDEFMLNSLSLQIIWFTHI